MGKLSNTLRVETTTGPGPLATSAVSTAKTGNGAEGYSYDDKSALFLLGVANFVGEDTFYEDAKGRDTRYRDLIRRNTAADAQWTADFLRWLRHDANMRSASILGAVEAARTLAKLFADDPVKATLVETSPRKIMDSVLVRADEPAEALGYWLGTYGKPLPKWLKRALGDAALRLYTPFTVSKWDSDRNPVRMADVVEFSQINRARGVPKGGIFTYLLDARHGRGDVSEIPLLAARKAFQEIPVAERRAAMLHPAFGQVMSKAGMTWEALSGWLQGPMDAAAWQVAIPQMRYGALIKNLANFDRAGIDQASVRRVIDVLTDPVAVKTNRLLPMAYLNAYNNVPGDTYKAALDTAASLSLANVPKLTGRTLVLIDTSGSMNSVFTTHRGQQRAAGGESLMRWDAAALFGIALAMNCDDADVVSYSGDPFRFRYNWSGVESHRGRKVFPLRKGENLLRAVARFRKDYFIGGGTDTAGAVKNSYQGHDRIILLTDEQADPSTDGVFSPVPMQKPTYTFNLAGYAVGHAATQPNRFAVGGLSDAGFKLIASMEATTQGRWPWQ